MIVVRLLGRPRVERDDGECVTPRGHKSWAVLAYLRMADQPVPRSQLAQLLFSDAADPLGALRWTLAELRRCFAGDLEISGDPIVLRAAAGVGFDIDLDGVLDTADIGVGELLGDLRLDACLQFDSWSVVARHRVSAQIAARLRQRVTELLACGRAESAVVSAHLLVDRAPFDEGHHELLVRSLAATGDREGAMRQVAICEDLFARELGLAISDALREAASAGIGGTTTPPLAGHAGVTSQLDAGRAAIMAGAVDAGVQCLRRATADAERLGDQQLRARTLFALGAALVHTLRGRDAEGAIVLQQAVTVATDAGDRSSLVQALRELGFVEVQAGRRRTAEELLGRAAEGAETDEEHAGVLAIRGMNASDAGDYSRALPWLSESIERAAACGDERQQAWSLSILGRAHLLRGEYRQADLAIARSLRLVDAQRWLAFQPWPQALHAELQLLAGDVGAALYELEQAWSLACTLADPCWEAMAARGIALTRRASGDREGARHWLTDAQARCVRVTDPYQWVHAYVLDAAAADAIACGDHVSARSAVRSLTELAARCEMQEMTVRALVHQHALGDPTALTAARLAAHGLDNPQLEREYAAN